MEKQISITTGDLLHLYGGLSGKEGYTVRLLLTLKDALDPDMLKEAVSRTQQRFPYLSLRLTRDGDALCYEANEKPIKLFHTRETISLNSPESNGHQWAVCYEGRCLMLDISHGLCDGTGMYMLLSTLLYYYCSLRYGVTDHSGIRILEESVQAEEQADPLDALPQLDPSLLQGPRPKPAFSLLDDGHLTACEPVIYDLEMDEESLVRYACVNDASPGILICALFSKAIDGLFPQRTNELKCNYICNARPMLGALQTHHNCSTGLSLVYKDKMKQMPFTRLCTVYRGMTFLQSDEDRIAGSMTGLASLARLIMQTTPSIAAREQAFYQMLRAGRDLSTFMVSYVGQWKKPSVAPYIEEFYTHVPNISGNLITEIAAINGKIFLTIQQSFLEDCVLRAFLKQLEEAKIPFRIRGPLACDNARYQKP